MSRRSILAARRLSDHVLEGLERRGLAADVPADKLPEIIELRAVVRNLIAHINALEFEQRDRMGLDDDVAIPSTGARTARG